MASAVANGTNVRTIGTDEAKNRAVLYRLVFLTLGGVIFENRRDIIGVELKKGRFYEGDYAVGQRRYTV